MHLELSEYSAKIVSDRNFELMALKAQMRANRKLVVFFIVFILCGLFYFYLAERYGYYGIFYYIMGLYFIIYPALLYYLKSRPKEYRVSTRGVWINGNFISWKNFKGYRKDENFLYLIQQFGDPVILPAKVENVVKKYIYEIKT